MERVKQNVHEFKLIIATLLILFFVGVKDDIIGTSPIKKLIAHVLVGLMLVQIGGIRITSLHGIFGIEVIPEWASIFLSLFTYVVVVNGFNLIDGVDGLAAGVGFISSSAMGTWFIFANDYVLACLAFSLAGSLIGFLIFNFSPAKIFMGDSGSLTIGLLLCILSIKLIEYPPSQLNGNILYLSKPVFAIAAIFYPLADTLRIFTIRAFSGQSPFSADKNHLHHRILACGFSHVKTAILIYIFSVAAILISLISFPLYNFPGVSLIILIAYALLCTLALEIICRIRKTGSKKNQIAQDEISEQEIAEYE
mgnify:FL=1